MIKQSSLDALVARDEIRALRSRYSFHFDNGDAQSLAALFCVDAICQFGPDFGGDWVGRDIIQDRYNQFIANRPVKRTAMLHLATNDWIELQTPVAARGQWYFTVVKSGPVGTLPYIFMAGTYDDLYIKEDETWLISPDYSSDGLFTVGERSLTC